MLDNRICRGQQRITTIASGKITQKPLELLKIVRLLTMPNINKKNKVFIKLFLMTAVFALSISVPEHALAQDGSVPSVASQSSTGAIAPAQAQAAATRTITTGTPNPRPSILPKATIT